MLTVLLGISGSISAYKSPELIRRLKKQGYRVIPILTESALQFVTPLAIESVAQERVWIDTEWMRYDAPHLELVKTADVFLTAPCSANTLTKFAHGISDSLLSACFISSLKPKLIAPAMHTEMWENEFIQQNCSRLIQNGVDILGPATGDLASGDWGPGRLVDSAYLISALELSQRRTMPLRGKRILITAGGTTEPIDSVRVITNRSTGMLGIKLAHYASLLGASVHFIGTPSISDIHLFNDAIPSITVETVSTASEMQVSVDSQFLDSDWLLMAAAVSDFTVPYNSRKLRRNSGRSLALEPTVDILAGVTQTKRSTQLVTGFCMADQDQIHHVAVEKLQSKALDLLIANSPEVFGEAMRQVYCYQKNSSIPIWSGMFSVEEIAYRILLAMNEKSGERLS